MGMIEEMPASFDPAEVIDEFEAMTRDAERVQRETLKKILELNSGSEYIQKWGLEGKTDPESFKACVPLATHEDLEPYIQRIVDGDKSPILTGKPFTTISLSSGTSRGMPKFVPFNDDLMENTMQVYKTSYSFRNRDFPIGKGKCLQLIYGSKQFKTKGGLKWVSLQEQLVTSSNISSTGLALLVLSQNLVAWLMKCTAQLLGSQMEYMKVLL